ncbi:response regulator [Mariprofundus sp. EBB-1]|uniref:hybrid sensor histidine kinase/response regulator n=1 Tax=Mariprofundus sp. EBB-1 TaxID=2650971 RepID=UPI000EF2928B|nr:response regulator [Mariprofundus sp. EBB-1]RLL53280.1 response regulator [Mariprofundus sp. EBB-1]
MLKVKNLNQLLHNHTGDASLAETQLQQTKARILLTCASLSYIILHGDYFDYFMVEALSFAFFYFATNFVALIKLRKTTFSAFENLAYPVLDVIIVSFGMLIDGGHSSGVYFMLLVIIIGNGLRFGNPMLIYTQVLCLIGLATITSYAYTLMQIPVDITLLSWQIFTLLAVPFYVYLIVRKLEKAIKDKNIAEETSFHLLDKGPLPVFTYDLDQRGTPRVRYANDTINHMFQHNHQVLIGEPVDIFVLAEDSQEILEFCRQALDQKNRETNATANNFYIRGRDKSGNILKLMLSTICMRWRDHWIGVCFMMDITQRETTQEEMESVHRYAYMSTLVAGIVHDFRNVLTNMIGYAEVMQMNSTKDSDREQLEAIIAAGERGSELTSHLLKLGHMPNDSEPAMSFTQGHTLAQPLEHIIGLTRLQLPSYIQLQSHIEEPLHDVSISTTEIEQILLNLINNSTQAISENGQIAIDIRNEPNNKLAKPGHPCLCIRVTDNGAGITADHIDSIFKPFWTSKSTEGGSGLGLTMVERIIKRNHGSIDVTSTPYQATSFTVHLPPYIPPSKEEESHTHQQESPALKQQSAPKQTTYEGGDHALVVDDVADIVKIHQAMLTHLKITSDTAENGQEALAMLQQPDHPFDLVITDYKMPVMDGLQLIQHIRQFDEKLPIVMITAFGEDHQLLQAIDYNVTLLNKPINMDKLKDAVINTLAK